MDKKRQSKFSFSRQPQSSDCSDQQVTLQSLKNKFKGQMQLVINRNDNLTQDMINQQFLTRINIELTEEDRKMIRFDMKEYQQKYQEGAVLGEGCIGLVKSVTRLSDGQQFACKTVKTDAEEIVKNMILEFKNLKKLQHENIVQMEELYVHWNEGFQATGTVCVIMEKINGMEMFEVIQKQKHYSESTARVLFKQVMQAIKFMHDNYCCHRDLKPNNILCLENGKSIKIADFNVSKFSESYKEFSNINQHGKIEMWTYTGTVAFSAPEIFSGALYNEQVDLWSAGVILYVMLSGKLPFDSDYLNDLIDKICTCKYEMTGQLWDNISFQAKNLIENLLQHDPQQRLTPEQALNHVWLTKECSEKDIPRDSLTRNMCRLLSVKPTQIALKREQKMRQLCYLFGAGDIWKRHSLGYSSNSSLVEEFKKFKSIDISGHQVVNSIQVTKDVETKGVYHIECPFSDSD